MLSLSRLTFPVCGLLIASSAAGAIALHERVTSVTQEPIGADLAEVPQLELVASGANVATAREQVPAVDPANPHAFAYVVEAGDSSYIQLEDLGDGDIAHGAAKLDDVGGEYRAVAPVAPANVPYDLRSWANKSVVVDGNCTARVTGFAIVSRLSGDTAYAGAEGKWTPSLVMTYGKKIVAAKLDGCSGTWARDASLPPAAVGIAVLPSPQVIAAARADLFASDTATKLVAEAGDEGDFRTSKDLRIETKEFVHPVTGQRLLYLHTHVDGSGACGGLGVDLLGIYRVDRRADGRDAPTRLSVTEVDMENLSTALDIDASGVLRLDAPSMDFGDETRALIDENGEHTTASEVPFFGCDC